LPDRLSKVSDLHVVFFKAHFWNEEKRAGFQIRQKLSRRFLAAFYPALPTMTLENTLTTEDEIVDILSRHAQKLSHLTLDCVMLDSIRDNIRKHAFHQLQDCDGCELTNPIQLFLLSTSFSACTASGFVAT
jgi:hypothetical protein